MPERIVRGLNESIGPDDLLVLDKPAGLLSHPNPPADRATNAIFRAPYDLGRELYRFAVAGGPQVQVHLIHRLDQETSGLILCAFEGEDAAARTQGADAAQEIIGCGAGASLAVGLDGRGGAVATGLGTVVLCALGFTLLTQAESALGLRIPPGWGNPAMLALVVLSLLAARRIAVPSGT